MLVDTQPDMEEQLIEHEQPKGMSCGDVVSDEFSALGVGEEEEPEPPAPFEFLR